jgi:hypothetical protein
LMVSILKPDGSIIETGHAVPAPNRLDWIYTANVVNEDVEGTNESSSMKNR